MQDDRLETIALRCDRKITIIKNEETTRFDNYRTEIKKESLIKSIVWCVDSIMERDWKDLRQAVRCVGIIAATRSLD